MGLPSGVLWAPCNIDVSRPNGFAKSPFQYDCSFFSWGNVDGHNPTGPASFSPWDWGGANAESPWYEGQVYGDTPGSTLTSNIPVNGEFDAAMANLGAPWRIPTREDFVELFENVIFINADGSEIDVEVPNKCVTVNGVVGLYLQSKINGARLFLSCSGYGVGSSRNNRGVYGNYWSSSYYSARFAWFLRFNYAGVSPQTYNSGRFYGYAVRPVMEL